MLGDQVLDGSVREESGSVTPGSLEMECSFHKPPYTGLQPYCLTECCHPGLPQGTGKAAGSWVWAQGALTLWVLCLFLGAIHVDDGATWPLCAPRADGPHPTAHGHLHQHQGAPRLLLCPLWARWWPRLQCSPHSCAPGCHARDCTVPGVVTVTSSLLPPPLPHDLTSLFHLYVSPGFRFST